MMPAEKLPVHRHIELVPPSRSGAAGKLGQPSTTASGHASSSGSAAGDVVIDIPTPAREEVVIDILERQPLLAKSQGSAPGPYAELPLAAVAKVAQHLDVGDLRSMALASSQWRSALGMPAVWLAASQRAGAAQLLRVQERLALTGGRGVDASTVARTAVFLSGAVPIWSLYGLIVANNFRDPSAPSQFLGFIGCVVGPLLGVQVGSIVSYMARPWYSRLDRAAEQRDAHADLITEQLEFGQACAREVLSPLPSDPALREAALGSLKRGLMRHAQDASTVQAAFARAVDGGDLARIDAMLGAGVARTAADLQAAPELGRKLLMLLITADRLDTVVSLAQSGLRLDTAVHGEVSMQALFSARLGRQLQEGNLGSVARCIGVLPQAATEHLPWGSPAVLTRLATTGLQAFPALKPHLDAYVDAACGRGDFEAATALRGVGCHGTAAATQHLARHLAQAVESKHWATIATLRQKLGVCVDHLAIKLDRALFAAIAAGDAGTVQALRHAGAPGKMLHASGRTPMELAQVLGAPEVVAALSAN